jgi:hypothetical protein
MLRAALLVVSAGLLLSAAAGAQSDEPQSLADAARKQKEKKAQTEEQGTKTLTNEDLPHSGGISNSASGTTAASSSGSATETASGEAASQPGEKTAAAQGEEGSMTQAEQADAARKELESLQHDENSFAKGITHLEELMANETSDSRRELYSNAIRKAQQNLVDVKQKRAEQEKKVAEMEAAAKQGQPQQEAPPQ